MLLRKCCFVKKSLQKTTESNAGSGQPNNNRKLPLPPYLLRCLSKCLHFWEFQGQLYSKRDFFSNSCNFPIKKNMGMVNNPKICTKSFRRTFLGCWSMDFISSISFSNEPLINWTFLEHFCHHFWVGAIAKQQQTHPKVMTKMLKKCSTNQRFTRKRNTYEIGTLENILLYF